MIDTPDGRTHFADDVTLAYISELENEVKRLIEALETKELWVSEAEINLSIYENMTPVIYADVGHIREVSNGNDMLIYASYEQDEQGRLEPLFVHPTNARAVSVPLPIVAKP